MILEILDSAHRAWGPILPGRWVLPRMVGEWGRRLNRSNHRAEGFIPPHGGWASELDNFGMCLFKSLASVQSLSPCLPLKGLINILPLVSLQIRSLTATAVTFVAFESFLPCVRHKFVQITWLSAKVVAFDTIFWFLPSVCYHMYLQICCVLGFEVLPLHRRGRVKCEGQLSQFLRCFFPLWT